MSDLFDLGQLRAIAGLAQVEHRGQVDSTNTLALDLLRRQAVRLPALVVADRQEAGRGRGANRWWSAPGGLTFSLALAPLDLPAAHVGRLSLAAAVAVCETIEPLLEAHRPAIKWPNDVLVRDRKLCGILVEAVWGREPRIVLGVGLNVNNGFADAPADLCGVGIALCDLTGRRHDLTEVLAAAVRRLLAAAEDLAAAPAELAGRWQRRSWLDGRHVAVQNGSHCTAGRCLEIGPGGQLRLETARGVEEVISGTVVEVR